MPRAGAVWVDVLPNMSGFGRQLSREVGEPVAQATQSAGEAGGEGLMSGMKAKMAAGALAVGAAVGVLVAQGISTAIEKQAATGRLTAQLGLDPKQAKAAGDAAGKLYTSGVTESVEEGASAVRAIMAAGLAPEGATTKQLSTIATKVQDLSSLFELDLGQTANSVGQIMKTGLAQNGEEAIDTLFAGMQKLGPRADDIADTFNEYSTIFRSLGLNVQTTMGLFSQGMQAGARDTDVIADSLKEFQIRATDGSEASAAGFKALGLSAKGMTAQIAGGGKGAADGLQLVLDKLRGIKDPVDRNAAAVALFGTKAEDMGQALFALNPSKAVADLGAVGGAAKKAGDDLRNNAGVSFETFKRKALMALGDAMAVYVLPRLMEFGQFLNADVLPKVQAFAQFLGTHVGPAVIAVGTAFLDGARWVKEYGAWFAPLAIAIGGVTLALNANAIATSISLGVLGAYSIAVRGIMAVTRAWAAAQALFNAIMALNPITLVVIALVALGAALVVAYQKSETFRSIVQGAWEGIKAVAWVVWTTVLKPALDGIWAAMQAVGAAASWLWNTILSPVFSFIGLAARVLFAVVVTAVLAPIVIAFKALAAIASWLWETVLGPVFGWIGDKAMWLWNKAIKPAWDAISAGLVWLGAKAVELWTNYISPVFRWIGDKAAWLWNEKIKPAWDATKIGIQLLGEKIKELWNTYAKPALQWIGDKAKWLWENALKPAFDAGKKGVGLLGDAFEDAKNAIGKAWDKLKGIAKGPVNFIIEWVYTKGIKAVWDKVAGFVGLGKLPVAPKLLATGGRTQGGTPGKDSIPALLMADEYVVKRSSARSVGFGTLEYINRTGQLPPEPQRFADGGVVGWIGDTAKAIGGAAMDAARFLSDPKAAWESVTGFVRNKIAEIGSSQMASTLAAVPRKMLSGLKDKVLRAAIAFLGGGGNGSWAKPVATALGTRYGVAGRMWSSGHHTGTDFPAPTGTAVKAVAGGVVQSALSGGPYGNHISIQHGGGLSSMYAHLSQMAVAAGQSVRRGQHIGAVGATGNVTGPHLHLEARRAGRTISPEPLLGYARGGRPKAGEVAMVGEQGAELIRFGPGGGTVLDHDSSLAEVGAAVMRGMTQEISPVVPAGTRTPAVVPVSAAAAGAERGGDTYNFHPRTLDMTVQDLELLQRQRDAQARVRRPR
jgi:phage-related minor tail protein